MWKEMAKEKVEEMETVNRSRNVCMYSVWVCGRETHINMLTH